MNPGSFFSFIISHFTADPKRLAHLLFFFVQLGFSSDGVMTDKKSSSKLIYQNKDTVIYTESNGVD
jgi:hypothetical protein